MSSEMNRALEFERRINGLKDRELLEFVARQNYETCIRCEKHDRRIAMLEDGSKKSSSIIGGVSGTITGIIIGLVSYFTNKG